MSKTPTTVTIPANIDEAGVALDGLGRLATATDWERSAIVYAFTYLPGSGRFAEVNVSNDVYTCGDFADLGFHGLRTESTVRFYHRCWVEGGTNLDLKPGDEITLPTTGFPPKPMGTHGYDSEAGLATTLKKAVEKHGSATVTKTLLNVASPDDVDETLALDEQRVRRINAAVSRRHSEREVRDEPIERSIDLDRQYQNAAADIVYREADRATGRWTPNEQTETIRHFLLRALNAATDTDAHRLVDEVTAYLEEVTP